MKKVSRIILPVLLLALSSVVSAQDCCVGVRGNIDDDAEQQINITDLVFLVTFMFQDGPAPLCDDPFSPDCPDHYYIEAYVNADSACVPDIADLVHLVNYMFQDGPDPLDCPPPVPDSVILPLTIGNEWISSYTEYNSSGQVIGTGFSSTRVVGDSTVSDWLWHIVIDSTTGGDSTLWTNREDGAWSYTDTSATQEALALKYPATPGNSYPYYDLTVTVADTDAIVNVPAGQFRCYYYELDAPIVGTVGKIWAAPNVGVVKAEQYDLNLIWLYLAMRVELESWGLID